MPVTRSSSATAVLNSNSGSRHGYIHRIEAKVDARESGELAFSYTIIAAIHRLRIPVVATPRRVDGLWRHSCFEAFFGVKGSSAYYEFNFSPSGEWAAYQFRAYRDGGPIDDEMVAPNISVEQVADRLTLTATIRLDRLPMVQAGAALRIGLSAVIEAADGTISYWALTHPSDRPDFHHADSFVIELALPDGSA